MQVSITTKGEVADRGAAARPEPPIRREHPNPERVEAITRRVAMAIVGQKWTQNGVNQTLHAGPAQRKMLLGFALRLMTDAKFDTAAAVHVVRVRAMCPAIQHWRAPSSIARCAGPCGACRQCPNSVGRTFASHARPRARRR